MAEKIPVSVIIVTKNAASTLAACLAAVQDFDEIIVVDSASSDQTVAIAADYDATIVDFSWNGEYPKKRQWCLNNVSTRHEWIFFVDADEIVSPELCREIFWNLPSTPHRAFYVRGPARLLRAAAGAWPLE